MAAPSRLLIAGKAALAASLAWWLAPLLPGIDQQYAYYAPLGVLVSMYPTVAASARSGLQALIGLALGIGIGLAGVASGLLGVPAVIALAVVVGTGMLFGAVTALGEGRSWVAIAAVFVLLTSGGDVEDFSVAYLVTMTFGVAVGVVVNLAIVPPLYLKQASMQLTGLRDTVSSLLKAMADHLEGDSRGTERLRARMHVMDDLEADVRAAVHEADESRRANPRRSRRRAEQSRNAERLASLERTAFYTRDLAEVLFPRPGGSSLSDDVNPSLVHAVRACARLVATPTDSRDSASLLRSAEEAVEDHLAALSAAVEGRAALTAAELAPAVFLGRIVDLSRPFVRADSP